MPALPHPQPTDVRRSVELYHSFRTLPNRTCIYLQQFPYQNAAVTIIIMLERTILQLFPNMEELVGVNDILSMFYRCI
jgi:hypothetical protein